MARSQTTDFYLNHKFHIVDANGGDVLGAKSEGGFSNCTLPDVDMGTAEYKEGIHLWTRKFPTNPTVSDVTLSNGVAKTRSKLWQWLLAVLNGNEYRTDLVIHMFHRTDYLTQVNDLKGDLTKLPSPNASRKIKIKQAFSGSYKPGSDLDSRGEEISLQEMTIRCESFEILEPTLIIPNAGIKQS